MDKQNERPTIGSVGYKNRRGERALVEVKSFSELRHVGRDGHLARPHRLDFHFFLYTRRGAGTHSIDFSDCALERGSVVAGHAGEVQSFVLGRRAEGAALLFVPAATGSDRFVTALLDPLAGFRAGTVPPERRPQVERALASLREAVARAPSSDGQSALIRHLLCATLILFSEACVPARTASPSPDQLVVAFARDVETHYRRSRDITEYARRLGCSARTLSRAVLRSRGQTPKDYLDERLALEAKRRLAYADDSIAAIGDELGFSEATNFTKFFRRTVGSSPAAFRSSQR